MLVGLSGPTAYYEPGAAYECDEAEAARLIGARYAVPWETAVDVRPIETRDALDHDSDGRKGGSLPGVQSTVAKGRRKKETR